MMKTVNVINKQTGKTDIAVYAPNNKGNMQYNIDGKFYTDKQFDKLFKIVPVSITESIINSGINKDYIHVVYFKPITNNN